MNSHCCLIGTAYSNEENDHQVIKLIWVWKFHKYLHMSYKMYLTSLSVTDLYYNTLCLWQIQYVIVQ